MIEAIYLGLFYGLVAAFSFIGFCLGIYLIVMVIGAVNSILGFIAGFISKLRSL